MKKLIVSIALLNVTFNLLYGQTPCAQKPEVTKYVKIGGQWGPQCAALALYLCQCSSGEVLKQDSAQFKSVIELSNSNVKTAHEQKLTKACPELIDKIKVCKYAEPKKSNQETKSSKSDYSKLNLSQKEMLIASSIIGIGSIIKHDVNQEMNRFNNYKQGFEYDLTKFSGETKNGIANGNGKMNITLCETYNVSEYAMTDGVSNPKISKYHMIRGTFDGFWKNGYPVAGTFSNYDKSKYDLSIQYYGINGHLANNGVIFFNKLMAANFKIRNFKPDRSDSVEYNEYTDILGKYLYREKQSALVKYTAVPDDSINPYYENIRLVLYDSTIIDYKYKLKGIVAGPSMNKEDSVIVKFTNGDKYCYRIKGNAFWSAKKSGTYYFMNGKSVNKFSEEFIMANDQSVKDNYFSFLFAEAIINHKFYYKKEMKKMGKEIGSLKIANPKTAYMQKYCLGVSGKNNEFKFPEYSFINERYTEILKCKNGHKVLY
jgi:hypothetical protein